VPVGGFSGDVPYPSVGQVRQLIEAGKISLAIVPVADVPTANDPRVRAVEQLCSEADGDPNAPDGYLVYSCDAEF
jgi:hypothetical protein